MIYRKGKGDASKNTTASLNSTPIEYRGLSVSISLAH